MIKAYTGINDFPVSLVIHDQLTDRLFLVISQIEHEIFL